MPQTPAFIVYVAEDDSMMKKFCLSAEKEAVVSFGCNSGMSRIARKEGGWRGSVPEGFTEDAD